MRRLVLLLCVFLPLAVQAADNLERAEKLFRQTDYRRALKVVARALKDPGNGPESLVAAYKLQGLCYAALGRKKQSVNAFLKLLSIDPEYKLSKYISPKLSPPFYRAAGRIQKMKPITLVHEPPESVDKLAGTRLDVSLDADPSGLGREVRLCLQYEDGSERTQKKSLKGPGKVSFELSADAKGEEAYYFIELANRYGAVLKKLNDAGKPFRLQAGKEKIPVEVAPVVEIPAPGVGSEEGHLPSGQDEQPPADGDSRWYETWWFWTAVGVVVAGAAAGTAVALTSGSGSGGPYEYGIQVR